MPVEATPSRRMSWAALNTIRSRGPRPATAIVDLPPTLSRVFGHHSMTAVMTSPTMTAVIVSGDSDSDSGGSASG
ncbi:hypothetical protein GCM10027072_26780 [Streptomyces bullii]